MSEYIVEDKTCMIRVNSADKKETSQWKVITDIVANGGKLPAKTIGDWFERRKIPIDGLTRDEVLIAKALYGMLQISCIAIDEKRVGVFFRRNSEAPFGQEKITTGYSLMRSWSPRSIDTESLQAAFIKKTGFSPGSSFDLKPLGLGYNDLLESSELTGPGYLFMVHKLICDGGQFPCGEWGATNEKSGETFIGFFDPRALYEGRAVHQDEPIKFKARMDNLILRSLVTGDRKANVGILAAFNQDAWVSGDTSLRFKEAVDISEQDKQLIDRVRKITKEVGMAVFAKVIYEALRAGVSFSVALAGYLGGLK